MSSQDKKSPPKLDPERRAPFKLIDIRETKQPDFIEQILAEAGMPAELPDIGGRVRERKRKAVLRKAVGDIPTAGCKCVKTTGYFEVCHLCWTSKQELIGTRPTGTENTSFGKAGGIPFIDPLRYCLRLRFAKKVLALHFEGKEDLGAACGALEALDVLLFQQKPLHETWLAMNTYLYGGALEYGLFQPKPLSTREVCRKLKRKGLSERTVRRYLQPLRPQMAAVQTALARGHLLPEGKEARDTYLGDLIVNAWKRQMGFPSDPPPRQ